MDKIKFNPEAFNFGSTQKFSHRGYFVEAPEAQEEEEGLPCRPL
jgi:hypothetical protein